MGTKSRSRKISEAALVIIRQEVVMVRAVMAVGRHCEWDLLKE